MSVIGAPYYVLRPGRGYTPRAMSWAELEAEARQLWGRTWRATFCLVMDYTERTLARWERADKVPVSITPAMVALRTLDRAGVDVPGRYSDLGRPN